MAATLAEAVATDEEGGERKRKGMLRTGATRGAASRRWARAEERAKPDEREWARVRVQGAAAQRRRSKGV
eukprot:3327461-Pleurochrysis_carterae.AAC.5